jgi:serine/threonine protein kinase
MANAPERNAGDVLDRRYRLTERLGRGGFGDVWRAEELLPDGTAFREVALKLLSTDLTDVAQWSEEAKLLASFRHPSLVTVFAAGVLEGAPHQPFVAMELLLGESLADIIKERRRIPWRRVLGWARDAAAALDVIHVKGVVHLDLKPANLFLARDGALKVLDFGISRRAGSPAIVRRVTAPPAAPGADVETAAFVAENDALAATNEATNKLESGTTAQRTVVGTPGFMAPEVFELAEPTAATDAYALAVCIVQLTTGRLPYLVADQPSDATDPSTVLAWWSDVRSATLRGELRDLARDAARLPRGLVGLLKRLLAVDPAQRGVPAGGLRALVDEVWERPHGIPDPPYFGLDSYPPEAEGMLFGREDDVARLGRELEFEPCVVLQGPRGTGKSSLARVGLAPHLAKGGADGKDDWVVVEVRPGADPDKALAQVLAQVLGQADPELRAIEGGADAAIEPLAAFCKTSPVGVVLVIDPLEEIASAEAAKGARLSALLAAIAEGDIRPGLRVACVLGEERTQAVLDLPLGAVLRSHIRYVAPPTAAAADEIAFGPAELAGAQVSGRSQVVGDIQRELRGGDARLPFVALALRAFWEAREVSEAGVRLRVERWKELGGVEGALATHAGRVLAAMGPEERRLADELLIQLWQTDGTVLRWEVRELIDTMGSDAGAAEKVLSTLEREHLVRVQRGNVEVAHPALLTSFKHLAATRLQQMERLIFLERVREAAVAWSRSGEHRDFLLTDALLHEVRERRAWAGPGLSARERELVRESLRRSRLRTAARGAMVAAGLLAVVGGVIAKREYDRGQAASYALWKDQEQRAYVAESVARARSSEDPFHRAAWIAEAMRLRSTDGTLPLDLFTAVANVPRARFLTLTPVTGPTFPWDDRWILGGVPGSTLTIIDLFPPEPGVVEDMNIDADPEAVDFKKFIKNPSVIPLRPYEEPVVEQVPFAFDTAFATRSTRGEVRVFRLRPDGSVALAAIAPMACAGALRAAERAPVLACATEDGLARWDLRRAGEGGGAVDKSGFRGIVLDVSPDGSTVAATLARRVMVWRPEDKRELAAEMQEPVLLARFSPRDGLLALVHGSSFNVVDTADPKRSVMTGESAASPVEARWHEGGLDLAVCSSNKREWHFLRKGARPKGSPAPAEKPCYPPLSKDRPQPIEWASEAPELAERDLGPHAITDGFRMATGSVLSRDLVVFSGGPPVGAMLRFRGVDATGAEEIPGPGVSARAFARIDEKLLAFQVGEELRFYSIETGRREKTSQGNMLRVCSDGRVLAWSSKDASYRIFDARAQLSDAAIPRAPGLILAADAACSAVLTQRLDGTLVVTPLAGGEPRPVAQADGYVYAVSPSPGKDGSGSGSWLALSSGAIAWLDDASMTVERVGYATPRATAIGDGPGAGEVAFADSRGVAVMTRSGELRRVLATTGETVSDLSTSPDGSTMLLASGDRLRVLDIGKREVVGELLADGRSRLSAWDREGSVLAWSFDRVGGAEGQVIPRGLGLAVKVAEAASNLRVENRRLALRR